MRRCGLVLCVSLFVTMAACHHGGGQSPTSASSAVPQPVSVLSGRTGQPVPGIASLTAVPGQGLTLTASGFFTLKTDYRGEPIVLWPADDGFLTSACTRSLVYGNADPGRLFRLPPSVTTVTASPDGAIQGLGWAADRVQKGTDVLSQKHPSLTFQVGATGQFVVSITVNPGDPGFTSYPNAAMLTYVQSDNASGIISSAKIVVRSLDLKGFWYSAENFQSAIEHELIHATGLNHLPFGETGLMSGSVDAYSYQAPTAQEVLVMKMQYLRVAGTTLQGTTETEGATHAASEGRSWHLVCAR